MHQPLPAYLKEKFKDAPLDFIFDCVGNQALFGESVGYLKPKGRFISIVGGPSQGIVPVIRSKLIPTVLGGTPRLFMIVALFPSGARAKDVAGWVKKGFINEILIDSEFSMEEAVKVSAAT